MSSEPLPDDVNHWPTDPYRLLGVPHGADPSMVRRAYAQRIRKYKPEHHPEEFRRIRAAYELLFNLSTPQVELPTPFPVKTVEEPAPAHESREPWHRVDDFDDPAVLYARLRAQGRGPSPPGLILRLYWLLRLYPHLDPQRKPIDWLIAALSMGQTDPRLQALFRTDLERCPEDCERGDRERLYEALQKSSFRFEFASLRLQAAIRSGRWDFVQSELACARRALQFEQTQWIPLLLKLCGRLAWFDDPLAKAVLQECDVEIDKAAELHLKLSDQLDARDEMLLIRDSWRGALASTAPRSFGRALLELVPDTWDMPVAHWRPRLLSIVETWMIAPLMALSFLDRLSRPQQLLLKYLHSVLSAANIPRTGRQADYPVHRLGDLLDGIDEENYRQSRETLLQTCLRDGIDVDQIVERIVADEEYSHLAESSFLAKFKSDLPLRCVVRGCALFQT